MDEETAQFIREHLDSRTKLEVALFLHANRFALESAAGLAARLGRAPDDMARDLNELVASQLLVVHGSPETPCSCLFGFTDDGLVAKRLDEVFRFYMGDGREHVLKQVLDGEMRSHNLRLREHRKADSLKTQFLSIISHELRTPLTAIKGYVELLQANPGLDNDQRGFFLDTVAAQCDRLGTTINNLLLAAEMEHEDGWRGECRPIALETVVERLVEEIRRAEPRRQFRVDLDGPVPLALADEIGLEMVVRNLLDNAVKFSLDGSTIRVWYEDAGGEVLLHVGDEGIGISPERLRRIFERFYQAEYYRTRRAGGAGLGLYLVKEVMEGMGGRIAVRSELGRGSIFTCAFVAAAPEPVCDPAADPGVSIVEHAAAGGITR